MSEQLAHLSDMSDEQWALIERLTKMQGALNEVLPEAFKAKQHAKESEPGSANS